VLLEDPHLDLSMAINLEGRTALIGRSALGICRKLPHLVCSGYLPSLGHAREWQGGRHKLDAQSAFALVLDRLRAFTSTFETVSLALPPYLTLSQVNRLAALAAKYYWPIGGTALTPLALAADRAAKVLQEAPGEAPTGKDRVIPMHRNSQPTLLIVDADDFALTGSVIRIERDQVHLISTATWSKLGTRTWKDRMLEALCDRCIRLCRRDPRDSADAEQEIYEQLDVAMDRVRSGQKVSLTVRAFHWYQDIEHQPSEFESYCAGLLKNSVESIQELVTSAGLSEPPVAVWLTHEAGRLPGLSNAIHQHMAERTRMSILQPEAVAIAAANLADRRKTGEVPRTHLDTTIPIVLPPSDATKVQAPASATKARR
jgi:hypothetical protein